MVVSIKQIQSRQTASRESAETTPRKMRQLPGAENSRLALSSGSRAYRQLSTGVPWSRSMTNLGDGSKNLGTLERMAKMLPVGVDGTARPDALQESAIKRELERATDRIVSEGYVGEARIAFEATVDDLFRKYADDLDLDDTQLAHAKNLMIKDARELLSDFGVKPWKPGDSEVALGYEDLRKSVHRSIGQRRQWLMEASGDFSRVLSELTRKAGRDDDGALGDLDDFINRFEDALNIGSAHGLKRAAKDALLGYTFERKTSDDYANATAFLQTVKNTTR